MKNDVKPHLCKSTILADDCLMPKAFEKWKGVVWRNYLLYSSLGSCWLLRHVGKSLLSVRIVPWNHSKLIILRQRATQKILKVFQNRKPTKVGSINYI